MTRTRPLSLKSLLGDYLDTEKGALSGQRLHIRRGDYLLREGDPAGELYYVIAGRFRVVKAGRGLGEIEAGSVVGELAFLTGAIFAAKQ